MMQSLVLGLVLLISAGGEPEPDSPLAHAAELNAKAVEAQNAGNYEEAETYRRATLAALKRVPDYPLNEWARQLSNLASLLNLRGRSAEALELLAEADEILEANPSFDPGQYITLDHNLGRAYALLEDWAQAEEHYKNARASIEAAEAAGTGYEAETWLGMAYVYWKTDRLELAAESYDLALDFFQERAGRDHPVIQRIESELAQVRSELSAIGEGE